MAETNNISGAADAPEQNNTSGAGAPEEQHDHEHHHEHHHHHHHHRSPAPIHEMHKVQRRVRHTMKHMQKWQVVTAVAAAAALAVFAGFSVLKYQEKKRTEAEIAAWYAQNGLDGQNPGDGQRIWPDTAKTAQTASQTARTAPAQKTLITAPSRTTPTVNSWRCAAPSPS